MPEPLVKNVGDEEQVRKAGTTVERRRARQLMDVQWIAGQEQGKRLLLRILALSGIFDAPGVGVIDLKYEEGKRKIGVELLRDLRELDPALVGEILKAEER